MNKNEQGIQFMKEGKWEEAAKAFIEAIEANPDDAVAYINFGNVLSAVGDIERAMNFFQKAIELEGGGAAYYSAGTLFYEKKQYNEAKDMFEKALKAGLATSDNYFMLGMCFVHLQTQRLALPYLQRAVELNEKDTEALFQYGLALARSGAIDEAIVLLEKCVALDAEHADAYYNLGVAHAIKQNREMALSMLDKALEIHPDHSLAKNAKNVLENGGTTVQ
jgi:tetratricopeptide (TPR) repeat protein